MIPSSLNKQDPCYIGIKRVAAILSNAEADGRIYKRDLRLDIFYSRSGGVQGYRVNLQTNAGWQTATFSQDDLKRASDEAYFEEQLAQRVNKLLYGPSADEG